MKVLIIGNKKHQFIYNYASALRENNVVFPDLQIDILSQDTSCLDKSISKVYDNIFSIRVPVFLSKIRLFRILSQLILLSYYIHKMKNYDIVHIHYLENIIVWNRLFSQQIKGKLIVSIWGSDFLRSSNRKRYFMQHIFNRADQITIASPTVKKQFDDFYNGKYHKKISICQFGLQPLENIADIRLKGGNKNKITERFLGIVSSKIIVTIGYNASILQQHKDIVNCIESCDELTKYKDKIEFILPCTYPKNYDYLNTLSSLIKESKFHYTLLTDFLSDDDIAKLRICTDIFIQLQLTDMLSGSMLEHLAAGNIVVTGKWLPYDILDQLNIYMLKIDQIKNVTNILCAVIKNYNKYIEKCSPNEEIILDNFRWKQVINKWFDVYKKVLN